MASDTSEQFRIQANYKQELRDAVFAQNLKIQEVAEHVQGTNLTCAIQNAEISKIGFIETAIGDIVKTI